MVKGLNPENFIKEFEPGSNPFEVTIVRLMNPRTVDIRAMDKPILVKLLSRIKMRSFSDAHRKAFENLVRAIDVKEMFCGIFTPDVSEIYFDGDVMIVDLTSYLKPGMETKIAKLFQVASESPKVHVERIPNKEVLDRAITNRFLQNVDKGMSIGEALKLAIQQQEDGTDIGPRQRDPAATPPPLPPPPPPPPQPITRVQRTPPPVVTVNSDPAETAIEGKLVEMERIQKEKETAEGKEDFASKGRKTKKAVRRVKKKGAKDTDPDVTEGMDEGQTPAQAVLPPVIASVEPPVTVAPPMVERAEPPVGLTPAMDDTSPEGTVMHDTSPSVHTEVGPEPGGDDPVVERPIETRAPDQSTDRSSAIRPPPAITKEPEIDISVGRPSTTPSSGGAGVGDLMSRLKGVSLDAPKELAREAPRVSEQLMAATPPPPPSPPPEPPNEETKPKPWEKRTDAVTKPKNGKAWEKTAEPEPKVEQSGIRIPPPPSISEEPLKPVEVKATDKPKPKTGESGLDDLMKKLRAHK